jgi:hypothetical protein
MNDDELADFVTDNEVIYNDDSLGPREPRRYSGWLVAIVALIVAALIAIVCL